MARLSPCLYTFFPLSGLFFTLAFFSRPVIQFVLSPTGDQECIAAVLLLLLLHCIALSDST